MDTKTLYNRIKQLAPTTIMDNGDIIVWTKNGRLRVLETDEVTLNTDGSIDIYRVVKGERKHWEVIVAGSYSAGSKPKSGSTVKQGSSDVDGSKKTKKKVSKKASKKRKSKASSRKAE